MEPSESYEVLHYIPAASLPYSQPGSCYSLVRLPEEDPTAGTRAGGGGLTPGGRAGGPGGSGKCSDSRVPSLLVKDNSRACLIMNTFFFG